MECKLKWYLELKIPNDTVASLLCNFSDALPFFTLPFILAYEEFSVILKWKSLEMFDIAAVSFIWFAILPFMRFGHSVEQLSRVTFTETKTKTKYYEKQCRRKISPFRLKKYFNYKFRKFFMLFAESASHQFVKNL